MTIGKQIFDRREYDKIQHAYDDDDDDDDDDEYDDDEYDDDYETFNNVSHRRFAVVNKKKVGRNEPCPCGSGKKYKHCCGK